MNDFYMIGIEKKFVLSVNYLEHYEYSHIIIFIMSSVGYTVDN